MQEDIRWKQRFNNYNESYVKDAEQLIREKYFPVLKELSLRLEGKI